MKTCPFTLFQASVLFPQENVPIHTVPGKCSLSPGKRAHSHCSRQVFSFPRKTCPFTLSRASILLSQENAPVHTVPSRCSLVPRKRAHSHCSRQKWLWIATSSTLLKILPSSDFLFLNKNPNRVIVNLETMLMSYVLWGSLWRTKIQLSYVIEL